jgi:histidinol-phosphate aminotransferase
MDQKVVEEIIKLSQNENNFGPSPMALKAVIDNCDQMNRYPEPHSKSLKNEFSNHLGIIPENIFVCAGLVESLDIMIRNFIVKGENLIIPKITFVAYKLLAKVFHVETRFSEMKDYGIDIDSIIESCDEKTKLIIIANPNNPTGTIVNETDLIRLMETVPKSTYVVADEAYCEYINRVDFPNTMKLLQRYPNLIMLRTFSKIYGLAGLRVGFAVAHEDIIKKLEYFQAPFTVSQVATIAASAAMKDHKFLGKSSGDNSKSRSLLERELSQLGYNIVPSQSNFIYIHFETQKERDRVCDLLADKNVLVRKTDPFGDEKAFRITVPRLENAQKVIDALRQNTVAQK